MTDTVVKTVSFPLSCSANHIIPDQSQLSEALIQDPNNNTDQMNTAPVDRNAQTDDGTLQIRRTSMLVKSVLEHQGEKSETLSGSSDAASTVMIQSTEELHLANQTEACSKARGRGKSKPCLAVPVLDGVLSRRAVFEKWAGLECEEQRPSAKRQLSAESAAKCVSVRKRSTLTKSKEDEPQKQPRPHTGASIKPSKVVSHTHANPEPVPCRPCAPTDDIAQRRSRKQLFSNSEVFHRVDTYAVNAGRQLKEQGVFSAQSIARAVTQGARNELEKLRAIWVWLCHNIQYDLEGYLGLSQKLCSPEEVIKHGRGICSGYSSICLEMCREVGIECQEVSGYSKGIGHKAGRRLQGERSDHMWNAVWVRGQWGLLDACWGAGTVHMETRTFIKRFDDFYFLTEPSEFINSHFPDDPCWQLLVTPIAMDSFQQTPLKTSAFYTLGLSLIQPKQYALVTDGGEATVSLVCSRPLNFTYELRRQGAPEQTGEVDASCGLLTVTRLGMSLRLLPPEPGAYQLKLFARPEGEAASLRWVCSLELDCPDVRRSRPMPENPYLSWGLASAAAGLGVRECSAGGGGEAVEVGEAGECEVVLHTTRPLMMVCELAHHELEPTLAKRCLATQIGAEKLVCHVLCPYQGFYRLSMFVKEYEEGGGKFQNAGNFLLHCKGRGVNLNCLYPPDLGPWCGPGMRSQAAGLSHFSHTGALVNMVKGRCNITFHCASSDLQVHAALSTELRQETTAQSNQGLSTELRQEAPLPLSRHVLLTFTDNKVTVSACAPRPGVYRLGLYGRTPPGQDYAPLCDFVLRSVCERSGEPFPCVYSAWGRGCVLMEPRAGVLPPRSWVCFRVRVPGARRVCVLADEERTELKMNKSRVWEGEAHTADATQLKLAAVTGETNHMPVLMTFDVLSLENEP